MLVGGEPAGVLTIRHRGDELHIKWIAVVPAHQGSGLGSGLLRLAQQEAAAAGLPLTLRVMRANRAVRLYERLGFEPEADAPPPPGLPTDRIRMRWPGGRIALR